ncbi:polyketide cyclase / dehydrase and lipid transport [Rhodococcus sp. X156]|uniref:polyketide cyclase / dehydrase and lipid transport n=1 Tax=Rhodococcus sp. X156 TaxID=2499145 RepID=UPI000FD9FAF8|nr:polyketide cyclase / dehydrase and lipid transport [Rhodococcus sp. X156]
MSALDVVDETFLAVAPAQVAAALAPRQRWRRWWPELSLHLHDDRGPAGLRWRVSGAVEGSMEVWLEPVLDGTVLHYFLRAEVPDAAPEEIFAAAQARRRRAKALAFELKAELEAGRAAGEAPAGSAGPAQPSGPTLVVKR